MTDINVVNKEDFESCNNLNIASIKNAADDNSHVEQKNNTAATNTKETRKHYRDVILYKMYMVFRELCLLILIATTYALFQNTTPKVSKSPNAYPFFLEGSIVKDWYHGQLGEAIEIASESDVAFIMYYAPWDAESQAVRSEFDAVAQHMHTQIHFAAINCWQPGSECRQQYSKVYSWPVLMAYPIHGRGIQYRGPKTTEYMIRFLQNMVNPVKRVNNLFDIKNIQGIHDAFVLAIINANLGSAPYGTYYTAALKFLERDPFRDVQFLVYTDVSQTSSTDTLPSLQFYLWNETLFYPSTHEWNPELIASWLGDNLHQTSMWASFSGSKSELLSNYIQSRPALILFTPRNPLYSQIDYYSILRSVSLEYFNCDNKPDINIQRSYNWLMRKEFRTKYKQLLKECSISVKEKPDKFSTVISYDIKNIWLNNTFKSGCKKSSSVCYNKQSNVDKCTINIDKTKSKILITDEEQLLNSNNKGHENISDYFFNVNNNYGNNDMQSPSVLNLLYEKEKCHYFRMAHKLQPALFAPLTLEESNGSDFNSIRGMACKTNISLSMIAIDSLQYYYFAEALGIDILNDKDKTAVVILNPTLETHYVMKKSFSNVNLENFIYEYTRGSLQRTLSSQITLQQHTHYYGKKISLNTGVINKTTEIFIQELDTANFLPTIMQSNLSVIVMYYSTKCAYCSGVSHMILTTAKMLHSVSELEFARINGDAHALPWEFSIHQYPSILYFPARRKSESRAFPQNVPITVTNLLSFILANADSHVKIQVMWAICKQKMLMNDFDTCVKNIKIECMKLIGKLLRVYRFFTNVQQRSVLLKQLQHLRSLNFLLENPLQKTEIQNHLKALKFPDVASNRLLSIL